MNSCNYKTIDFFDYQVDITSLYQGDTYGGLVGGLPVGGINKKILKELVEKAKDNFSMDAIKIIRPNLKVETIYDNKKVEFLPDFYCIAELMFDKPANDDENMCSKAVVIWFQNEMAFPIDKDILKEFNVITWVSISEDINL